MATQAIGEKPVLPIERRRHQPFQGVRERSDFNELSESQNARSDI